MNRPCLSSGRAGQTRIGRRRLAGSRATRLSAALAAVAALALAGFSTSPAQASGQVNMAETGPAAAAAPDNPERARLLVRDGQCHDPHHQPATLPGTRGQRQATVRRLHRHGRELVPLVRLRRRAGLVGPGQRGGEHQLPHLRQGHRHRRLLVHGRARSGSALQREIGRGVRLGRGPGGQDAARDRRPQGHLQGGLDGHRAAGQRAQLHARPRQRVEQRVHLDVQWPGQDPVRRGVPGPGGSERVRVLPDRPFVVYPRCLLLAADLELDLRHRERLLHPEPRRVDLHRRHPAHLAAHRLVCWVPPPARGSSAG